MDKNVINKEEELNKVNGGAENFPSKENIEKAAEAMIKAGEIHGTEALEILGGQKDAK